MKTLTGKTITLDVEASGSRFNVFLRSAAIEASDTIDNVKANGLAIVVFSFAASN